ncbi:hypothetical protein ACFL0W_03755 [Nanoarchaeota archaeon]
MSLVSIINGFSQNISPEDAAAAVESYAFVNERDSIKDELTRLRISEKQELSRKIGKLGLELLVFKIASGIEAQEQIRQERRDGLPGYQQLVGIASALAGRKLTRTETGNYLKQLAKENNLPVLTEENQRYVDNFSVEYVMAASQEQILEEIAFPRGVSLLNPKAVNFSHFLNELSKKISQDERVQFELLKKYTGLEAKEQLSKNDGEVTINYSKLAGLFSLLSGKQAKSDTQVYDYLKNITNKFDLPLLTQNHIKFIESFDVDYVIRTTKEELENEIPINRNFSLEPGNKMYVPFISELSKKISQDRQLQYELFKNLTGIEAQEQITVVDQENTLGTHHLHPVARLLSGQTIRDKKAHDYFSNLAKENDMPLLTKEHQDYINDFSVEYVQQTSRQQLKQEIPSGLGVSVSEKTSQYSPFMHELSKKISADSELKFELFKKWTGITAVEQISLDGEEGIEGYNSLSGFVSLLKGETVWGKTSEKGESVTRKYIEELVKENNLPLLTQEHQDYIDNFSVKYVTNTSKEKLHQEIPLEEGISLTHSNYGNHNYFLNELSKKISQDRRLQQELFKKWTGIIFKKQITLAGDETIPGYNSLRSLAKLISNEDLDYPSAGKFFKSIFSEPDLDFYEASDIPAPLEYDDYLMPLSMKKTPKKRYASTATLRKRTRTIEQNIWLTDIINIFDSKEYRALYQKGVPLNSSLPSKLEDLTLRSRAHRSFGNSYQYDQGTETELLEKLKQIRLDVYNAYLDSKELTASDSHQAAYLDFDLPITRLINEITRNAFEDEPNHFRRVLKKRFTQEWLQDMIDIFDSEEYKELFHQIIPLNSATFKYLEDPYLKERAPRALTAHKKEKEDNTLNFLSVALQYLQVLRPDVYLAYRDSAELTHGDAAKIARLNFDRDIDIKILEATYGFFNQETNYFKRGYAARKSQEWLQDIVDFFDSAEYQKRYEQGKPFVVDILNKIKDDSLRSKSNSISHLHNNTNNIQEILKKVRPDIFKAYTQSAELTQSEHNALHYKGYDIELDENIAKIVLKAFIDEENHFRRTFKTRIVGSWLQEAVDLFDSEEYQKLLYLKCTPYTSTLSKKLFGELRKKAFKVFGSYLRNHNEVEETAFMLLQELRPEIYLAHKQSQELDQGESRMLDYLDFNFKADKEISDKVWEVHSKEENYFKRTIRIVKSEEWLQSVIDLFDRDEYQELYKSGVIFNSGLSKKLKDDKLKKSATYLLGSQLNEGKGLDSLGIRESTFDILNELRPDIYKAMSKRIIEKVYDSEKTEQTTQTTDGTSGKIPPSEKGKSTQKLYDDEYIKLKTDLSKLKKLRKKPHKNNNYSCFSGFGKCFENYVGILLALNSKDIEHQYVIETDNSFRIVDFFIGNTGYVSVEDLDELVEVKSGKSMSKHDRDQLEDILRDNDCLTYVVHDRDSNLARSLIKVAEGNGKRINLVSFDELQSYELVESTELNSVFVNKENYSGYTKEKNKDQFEADLFSAYMWVKQSENTSQQNLNEVLSVVYDQDDELKTSASEIAGVKWYTIDEYNRESCNVFSSTKGRYFDLELAKKKLQSKIRKEEKELAKLENRLEDYLLRVENFEELSAKMEKVPEQAANWGKPPVILYTSDSSDSDYLVFNYDVEPTTYQINGSFTVRREITNWVQQGRVDVQKKGKYFIPKEAIQI